MEVSMQSKKSDESIAERIGISTNLFLEEENTLSLIRELANQFNYVEV